MNRVQLQLVVVIPVLVLAGCSAGERRDPAVSASPSRAPTHTAPSASVEQPRQPGPQEQAQLDEQLREAAWSNDVERARDLIERGADVNAKDETEQSAYLIATSEGHVDVLDLTLDHGATVDAKDSFDGTGLIRAAERGHAVVVGRLLQADIDRDHVNRLGYQAIHEAVWLGKDTTRYADTVRVLVAGGVQLGRSSAREDPTPLEMARQRGYSGLESVLARALDDAATITRPDDVLLDAARRGDADAVARALRAGADLEARDRLERSALLLAATHDRLAVARLLVAMGADPDALDHQHDTPWLVTGVTGSAAMLEALLPADPTLTIVNRFGGTSLIPASDRGHVDYVRRVLKTSIDIDHVNRLGWTALLEAVILGDGGRNHQEIVRLLLDAGADRSIADRDGVTALDHARTRGHAAMVRLLRAP